MVQYICGVLENNWLTHLESLDLHLYEKLYNVKMHKYLWYTIMTLNLIEECTDILDFKNENCSEDNPLVIDSLGNDVDNNTQL